MVNSTTSTDKLNTILNEYMRFNRVFTNDEINDIINEFGIENVDTIFRSENRMSFWLPQLKYLTIKRCNDNRTLIFVASIDEFIITDDNKFLLREYDTNIETDDPFVSDFMDVMDKTFIAAYLPEDEIINVGTHERLLYKLLSIIENKFGNDVVFYALKEYLDAQQNIVDDSNI